MVRIPPMIVVTSLPAIGLSLFVDGQSVGAQIEPEEAIRISNELRQAAIMKFHDRSDHLPDPVALEAEPTPAAAIVFNRVPA